jgi:uncharacterized protein YjbI with pentapeptide repeats
MANPRHFSNIKKGVTAWNEWRLKTPSHVNLANADLRGLSLSGVDFRGADLRGANLQGVLLRQATFMRADLRRANLSKAFLNRANLRLANLSGADLRGATLGRADLSEANLSRANLTGANLRRANLVEARLDRANLTGCSVYGISAWDVRLKGAIQRNLVVTPPEESTIQVDNLEVAQFVYLLLNNKRIRQVIDTITSKVVLILGRFTPERKAILDAIRERLRNGGYVPILFDFRKPKSRDTHETLTTLARMARFVIADITDAKSIPQELVSIVEQLPSVPVQPILHEGSKPWGMYDHIKRYSWVLSLHEYRGLKDLMPGLHKNVIAPAEEKAKELTNG